ncbi:PTS sugar transporter subunit IIC [Enterococcus casseliflavus]|uniref:PTS sugar transporter subunit IIC n=1 Tax=Enterococcus casseliflavus TaxID=37734 RepID=UPI001C48C55C|nr:PTS transporter subunit EIIC [Enterococcus casseliflavus]MBV6375488.1 PTS sugar transporter subunit IIC [Enterococcus casseliflavus]
MKNIMDKLEKSLNKYLLPIANKVNENKVVTAIKDGMIFTIPVILFASVVLIITNFPFLTDFAPNLANTLNNTLGFVSSSTMDLLSIFVIIGAATSYSKSKNIEPLYGLLAAFGAYLIATPTNVVKDVIIDGESFKGVEVANVISTSYLGASGIFAALAITIISIAIYSGIFHRDITIKMPESVPANVTKPFLSIIPFALTLIVFTIIRNLMELTPYGSLPEAISELLTKPLLGLGNNIWAFLFLIFVGQLLWFFGIHGTNITINAIWSPIATVAMAQNIEAFNAGEPLPYMLTAAFLAFTVQAKLSEIVALLVIGKSKRAKSVGRVSIIPAIFNIHEPFIFSLPIVLNTTLFIPFVFIEVIQAGVAYFLMKLTGAIAIFQVPWTTPPILSPFIATNFNPWSLAIALITFVVGFLLWAPFIKILDNQFLKEETDSLEENKA